MQNHPLSIESPVFSFKKRKAPSVIRQHVTYQYILRTTTACRTSDDARYPHPNENIYANYIQSLSGYGITTKVACETICDAHAQCRGIRWSLAAVNPDCCLLSGDQAWINGGLSGFKSHYLGYWTEPTLWLNSHQPGYECYEKGPALPTQTPTASPTTAAPTTQTPTILQFVLMLVSVDCADIIYTYP